MQLKGPFGRAGKCATVGGAEDGMRYADLMAAEFQIEPLDGNFGVAVRDVDLVGLSDEGLKALSMALFENRFVVVETGGLDRREYVDFARRVGEPIRLSRDADFPEIARITNIGTDTLSVRKGAAHWHTDQSFREELSSVTMLYSLQAPTRGGETRFCDMAAAYRTLPEARKREIADVMVEHRHGVSVAARPEDHTPIAPKGWDYRTVYHPLVRRHPITGETTLYGVTGTSQGIRGMERDAAASLLNELCDHAFQDRFIAAHAHRVHDLVMWDNPTTMHSATPIGAATGPTDTRDIHRISLRGYSSL